MRRGAAVAVAVAACGGPAVPAASAPQGAGAAASVPMRGAALQGPYADRAAFCAVAAEIPETDEFWIEARQGEVELGCEEVELPVPSLSTPFRGVAVISAGWSGDEGASHWRLFLGIRTEAGWFYGEVGELAQDGGTHDRGMALEPVRIEQRDLGGGVLAIVAEVRWSNESCNWVDGCVDDEVVETSICGVGPSGTPSCVPPLSLVERSSWSEYPEPEEGEAGEAPRQARRRATLGYPGGGEIELSGELEDPAMAGRHALEFP